MAKKNGIKPIKLILTGLLWGVIYLGVIIPAIGWILSFDFLSWESWAQKYQDWLNFKWKVNNTFDTILFFSMVSWIPLGLLGWRLTYSLKWEKLKPAPRPKKIKKTVFELNESRPLYHMPRKMPSTIQATKYVAPKLPNQQEQAVVGQKSHTNLAQMIRQVATLAKKYKVEIFQHILLEGFRVPMAISTDARAVLIEIVNRKKVNWSVEFSDDVTAGGWYSESGIMERLAQDLIGASKSLARSEPNSEVLSAILVTDGRVLNTKQAVEYFKSKGIFLLGYNNAEPKGELPDLASFLSTYFDLKEGETDPSPVPVQKVPLKSQQAQQAPAQEQQAQAQQAPAQEQQAQAQQAPAQEQQPQAQQAPTQTQQPQAQQAPAQEQQPQAQQAPAQAQQTQAQQAPAQTQQPQVQQAPAQEQQAQAQQAPAQAQQAQAQQAPAQAQQAQAQQAPAQTQQPQVQQTNSTAPQQEIVAKGFRGPAVPENLKQEAPNT